MSVRPQYASTSLYVGDLSPEVSETVLYEFFNSVGPVASIRVCRDASTRRSLGYAYINYHSIADAERAMDTLNHTVIKGTPCRIMWSQRDPTLRRANHGNLYVKNLDRGVDNRALHDTFSLFGNILSCKVATDETGKSKGYGFVHFESDEAALSAMQQVNGMKIWSKTVYVGPFCKKTERPSGKTEHFTNLYTRSFPPSWTEEKLKEIFVQYGEITSIWVSIDKRNRPFACVNYKEVSSAKTALKELNGRKCDVNGLLPKDGSSDKTTADESTATTTASKEEEKESLAEDEKIVSNKATDKDTSADANKATNKPAAVEEKSSSEQTPASDNKPAAGEAGEKTATESTDKKATDSKSDATGPTGDNTETNPTSVTEEKKTENEEVYVLFVDRAQDKAERGASIKQKFDQKAQQLRAQYEGVNLYIKNLSESVDDNTLRSMFERFGTITSAKVMKDESGHSKGFGFVCFTTVEEATKAYADMHLKVHDHKPLYVGLAEQKDRRHARLQHHFRGSNRGPVINSTISTGYGAQAPALGAAVPFFNPAVMHQQPQAAPHPPPQMIWQGPPAAAAFQQNPNMVWKGPYVQGHMPAMPSQVYSGQDQPNAVPQGPAVAMYRGSAGMPPARNVRHMENHRPPSGPGGPVPAPMGPPMNKQVLGEQLFPLVHKYQPTLAGKITGMMLDMDESELILLIESEPELRAKIDEALRVLEQAKNMS